MTTHCPCGLPAPYASCCGRYHGGVPAPTAEALMRSRYSAYVLALGDYLLASWHVSTRPESIDFDDAPKWLGLTVKQPVSKREPVNLSPMGIPSGYHGDSLRPPKNLANAPLDGEPQATVEFVAHYKIGGRAYRLHETSRFLLADGRWFYLEGDIHS